MNSSALHLVIALCLIAVGVAFAAAGFYVGHIDDAPGAGLLGVLLMAGAVTLGVRRLRRRG